MQRAMDYAQSESATPQPARGRFLAVIGLVLSLAGLGVTGTLVLEHVAQQLGEASYCGEDSGCGEVISGTYGKMYGQPTALWGFVFYAAMTAWFLAVGRGLGSARAWNLLPFLGAAAGASSCGYFLYIMMYELETICIFCLATHIITFLLCLLTTIILIHALVLGRRVMDTQNMFQRFSTAIVLAAAISTLGFSEYYRRTAPAESREIRKQYDQLKQSFEQEKAEAVLEAQKELKQQTERIAARLKELESQVELTEAQKEELRQELESVEETQEALKAEAEKAAAELEEIESDYVKYYDQFAAETMHDIPVTEEDSILGDPDAPHTVVVFSDFQCPHCSNAARMVEAQREEYPDLFRVVFKHFPLDQTCNMHVKRTLHPAACAAAVSAEAARKVKGDEAFWAFHDAFFANQKSFPKGMKNFVDKTAESLGIAPEELWKHINTTAAWERVKMHVEQGHAIGINSTPRVYFDGRFMRRWPDPLFWRYLQKVDERAGEPVIPPPAEKPADGGETSSTEGAEEGATEDTDSTE